MNPIAQMNDRFRKAVLTQPQGGGRCVVTRGVAALDPDIQMLILQKVKAFDTFTPDNDPYGEHDFGAIEMAGVEKVFWKIDIFEDATLQWGAKNPEKDYRVLTIMLADEY